MNTEPVYSVIAMVDHYALDGQWLRTSYELLAGNCRTEYATRAEADRARCPGMVEYGHGMNLTRVHGACCAPFRRPSPR